MFCSQCGNQIPDGSTFCPICGAQLGAGAAPAPLPTPVQPAPTYQQAPAAPAPAPIPAPVYPQASTTQHAPTAQQVPAYGQQAPAYGQQAPTAQQTPAQPKGNVLATPFKPFVMPSPIGQLFTGYNKQGVQYAESTGLQMKWYKALTAALLYISAAYMLFSGIQSILGLSYGDSGSYLYSMYPILRVVDILYGLFLLVVAFAALYVRMHLAQFASDGPRLYLTMLVVNGGISVVYTLLAYLIIGVSNFAGVISAIGLVAAMFVLNRTYFDKRQHLFTM